VQHDLDVAAEAGHALVDGVVRDLVDEVMEPALVGAADVHAGATAHRLQAAQDLDVAGRVLPLLARRRRRRRFRVCLPVWFARRHVLSDSLFAARQLQRPGR